MWRNLVLLFALPSVALATKKPPEPIRVIAGVPMRPQDIKPYDPPKLDPEPPLEASAIKVVEVTTDEPTIDIRPWSSPIVGTTVKGMRLAVKGIVHGGKSGCSNHVWYALEPFGYLCSRDARQTDEPAMTGSVLTVPEGERLPFRYVMVLVKEGDSIPMWGSIDDLKNGAEPEKKLEHGDTIAIAKPFTWDNEKYWVSVENKVLPQKGTSQMNEASRWHGMELTDATPLPFGWITPDTIKGYAEPVEKITKTTPTVAEFTRRSRVQILDEREVGKKRWLKVSLIEGPPADTQPPTTKTPPPAPDATPPAEIWVKADSVNEVRKLDRPATVPADITQWIDVDLGEQVLVLYEGDKPIYATLVSSGRAIPTPMGTYPVWAKVAAITMKNQPYEDKGYFVNKVPWSTFFQWHNAIHGAYWHDRFGVSKSHGCVNVAPLDARHVYEWVSPPVPPGWTGLRPLDLLKSPIVVVRDSHAKKEFRQDRPIGPPDRELESQRLVDAEKRRADEATAAAATPPPAPAVIPASATAPPKP